MDEAGRVAADAIVLAGGRASRLGGVDKPRLDVGGATLLDGAISAAVDAGCQRIVVAGPVGDERDPRAVWVREDPPFGGPAAGLAAALGHVVSPVVYVLAGDLASPAAAIARLAGRVGDAADGAQLRDPDGRVQPLAAVYRADALRAGVARLPDGGRDASMRGLLDGLDLAFVDAAAEVVRDVDTWEDLEAVRRARADRRE